MGETVDTDLAQMRRAALLQGYTLMRRDIADRASNDLNVMASDLLDLATKLSKLRQYLDNLTL